MEIKVWMLIALLVYVMWTFVVYKKFKEDEVFDVIVLSWVYSHVVILGVIFWAILDSVRSLLGSNPDINLFDFTIFKI